MSMYQPQKKHKAKHGNYYDKPTKKEVQANLNFWEGLMTSSKGGFKNGEVTLTVGRACSALPLGTQLKFKF